MKTSCRRNLLIPVLFIVQIIQTPHQFLSFFSQHVRRKEFWRRLVQMATKRMSGARTHPNYPVMSQIWNVQRRNQGDPDMVEAVAIEAGGEAGQRTNLNQYQILAKGNEMQRRLRMRSQRNHQRKDQLLDHQVPKVLKVMKRTCAHVTVVSF